MCAAFGFIPFDAWNDYYDVSNELEIELHEQYNIRIGKGALTITRNSPNKANIMTFGWKSGAYMLYNTRSEKVDKWPWVEYYKNYRCAVAVTYWVEFVGEKGDKRAHRFYRKDGKSFALAAVYDEEKDAFSILTTEPKEKLFFSIHDRQPVYLSPEEMNIWLDKDSEDKELKALFKPPSAQEFEVALLSKLYNSTKSEGKELLNPDFE